MNIVIAMFVSVFIKGISAIIELALQMLISNGAGIEGYGNYVFFVSVIECVYYLFFSANVKVNTYYLSSDDSNIQVYKKKYICRFLIPICCTIFVFFMVKRNAYGIMASVTLPLLFGAYDLSSTLMARKKQLVALLGEYLFGRIVFLILILASLKYLFVSGKMLFLFYGVQFLVIVIWLLPFAKKIRFSTKETKVSISKVWNYQKSDIANAIITYFPAILQFIFVGAFETGFTGIITVIRRVINFISGPTSKIFLPEMSKLYKMGDKPALQKTYVMIVKIQMIFIGTIATALISFPYYWLQLFSKDLKDNVGIFLMATACFLIISSLGPIVGILQMTGNESICARNQWISIGVMIAIMRILHKNPYFAVYGLSVQALTEGILEYVSISRWLGKQIIDFRTLIVLLAPVILSSTFVYLFHLRGMYVMLADIAIVFLCEAVVASRDPMVCEAVKCLVKGNKN